jgi:hypothetical protein
LEQVASHVNSILFQIKPSNTQLATNASQIASLCSLLKQLEEPSEISRESAWELAGEFERQLIALGDDAYLYTLLKDQVGSETDQQSGPKRIPTIARWNDYFPSEDLYRLRRDYEYNGDRFSNDRTRCEVRQYLRHLHLVQAEEHRRDRARISLRAGYFRRLTLLLLLIIIPLCVFYLLVSSPNVIRVTSLVPLSITNQTPLNLDSNNVPLPPSEQPWPFPAYLLLFVFCSGALGDVVSRAYRLGRQSLRAEIPPNAEEAPLGIRVLLSQGSSLAAQVALGGTAAVIIYIFLQVFSPSLDPLVYGVVGFLAGYSEAIFSRMLQETAGFGQRYSGV